MMIFIMPNLFFVTPSKNGDALFAKAQEVAGEDNCLMIHGGGFFVSFEGTNPQLKEKIGLAANGIGNGIVLTVSNYGGVAKADIWEWLKLKDVG